MPAKPTPTPKTDARPFLPETPNPTLQQLHDAAEGCRGCHLYKRATQVVFGEAGGAGSGATEPTRAKLMLIGEQPGDQEDLSGHPFVGPAGRLLDQALEAAGIDRSKVFVTNAVKHFKWTPAPRGKRRIHAKPVAGEIRACRPWLEQEVALVKPVVVVTLGATAGQSIVGPAFRVTVARGRATPCTFAGVEFQLCPTVHPSSLLRIPEAKDRAAALAEFTGDLRRAKALLSAKTA